MITYNDLRKTAHKLIEEGWSVEEREAILDQYKDVLGYNENHWKIVFELMEAFSPCDIILELCEEGKGYLYTTTLDRISPDDIPFSLDDVDVDWSVFHEGQYGSIRIEQCGIGIIDWDVRFHDNGIEEVK